MNTTQILSTIMSFKPYYKWNTFNTKLANSETDKAVEF